MNTKRILVVDDSVFMRKIISDLISERPGYQVVGTARNGREAVELAKKEKPDCITMDVEMPEMNGLEALKIIMKENPTPVIMLSTLTQEGALETIQALEAGAVDFVQKPSGSVSLDLFKVKEILYEKLDIAVQSKIKRFAAPIQPAQKAPPPGDPEEADRKITPNRPMVLPPAKPREKLKPTSLPGTGFDQLVAIGTSTGGPRALQQVLSRLPANFPAPIVIVQHMPPNFTHSLAIRLDTHSAIRVVEGEDGMGLLPGTAYVAPGGYHMRIHKEQGKGYRLRLSKEEPRGGHRPSVDTMFESILPYHELKRHIVIMTGMGSDGARGLHALKQQGAASTIAESEDTCVVYGMPRAAVELGGVDHLLPVHAIANKLVEILMK
ncbi:protein-glutamate methylesterase/protein-glutamine glutaminase [Gorillibacterium sp. sgz5001074]|uniref:protein-glutamate methylesterase/protein-glutamine glutaminase n=1 Tax=Gorillibacterium sp. sgz5001074 TaxID=3446695 RepID=UPI003F673ABA